MKAQQADYDPSAAGAARRQVTMLDSLDRIEGLLTALLAQRIEHKPSKLGVEGSNPSERANPLSETDAETKLWKSRHKDAVETKRRTTARLSMALTALQQIYDVCGDNAKPSCDHRMALDFVRQVAAHGFNAATEARAFLEASSVPTHRDEPSPAPTGVVP